MTGSGQGRAGQAGRRADGRASGSEIENVEKGYGNMYKEILYCENLACAP